MTQLPDRFEMSIDESEDAVISLADHYWDMLIPDYKDKEELMPDLFRSTEKAAAIIPKEYVFRLGWLNANGIGCEKSLDKAERYFRKAYEEGDWRGAAALSDVMAERMETSASSEKDKDRYLKEISEWKAIADRMYEESLYSDDEISFTLEED